MSYLKLLIPSFSLGFNLSVSHGGFVVSKVTVGHICFWEFEFIPPDIISLMFPHFPSGTEFHLNQKVKTCWLNTEDTGGTSFMHFKDL
jgi:hypothetical protein